MLRPSPRPTPGTAMAVSTEDTASDMPPSPPASTELLPLDTVCASVTLTLMPSMAMLDLDMDMEVMAMVDSTAMARGRLMLRPSQRLMHGTDTVVFTATVLALAMVDTALAMAMARGPLMPRPSQRLMPGTDTVAFMATVLALAMEGMVDSTAMERGPLMLRPSHGWDMVDSMAVGRAMVSPPSWPTPTAQ